MPYSTLKAVLLASTVDDVREQLQALLHEHVEQLVPVVMKLFTVEVTPESAFHFEEELHEVGRELLRAITEWTYNQLEGDDPETSPKIVRYEAGEYRRENEKTPNREVSTRFGKITLWRFPYRYRHRESEASIFPVELLLGLVEGATPALADAIAGYMADTGATQKRVLERLKREHGVSWGVGRLRVMTVHKAEALEGFRHQYQVSQVLEWLEEASHSSGKCKPILSVGRDGISVCRQPHGFWEVASVGTVTVYDRSGRRLGTVYLAQMPELGQGELTAQLKSLIVDILAGLDLPLPRLCYVTDAGENETQFYRKVLLNLRDPRRRRRRLKWYRIVDYFHAAERITAMSECLFRKDSQEGKSWARKMRKLLLKPNGASRVLHSAAALAKRNDKRKKMSKERRQKYDRAYNYLRRRTRFMDYHAYRRLHLPIGSGVTEAACKTVFTQRFKLSGMRWKDEVGQAVLTLRVLLLSGIWDDVRSASLKAQRSLITVPGEAHNHETCATAA
jgi:hypothetical protein